MHQGHDHYGINMYASCLCGDKFELHAMGKVCVLIQKNNIERVHYITLGISNQQNVYA